jgi:hypothetical protein
MERRFASVSVTINDGTAVTAYFFITKYPFKPEQTHLNSSLMFMRFLPHAFRAKSHAVHGIKNILFIRFFVSQFR